MQPNNNADPRTRKADIEMTAAEPRRFHASKRSRSAHGMRPRAGLLLAALVCGLLLLCAVGASGALAAGAWWHVSTQLRPAHLAPGGEGTLVIEALNIGDASTSGPVTVSDVLPPGLVVTQGAEAPNVNFFAFSVSGTAGNIDFGPGSFVGKFFNSCGVSGPSVSCTTPPQLAYEFLGRGHEQVAPYEDLEMRVGVKANPGAGAVEDDVAEVSGGKARPVVVHRPVRVDSAPVGFGVEEGSFSMVPEEEGGGVDVQAASHPFQLTTTFALTQTADTAKPPALAKNLHFHLPAGLVGNTLSLPQCSELDFRHLVLGHTANLCPADTVVGVVDVTFDEPAGLHLATVPVPLFNLVPGQGEPARFGFEYSEVPVTLDASVRNGRDYGVDVNVSNITELTSFLSSTVTFWGVPGASSHDASRGWDCLVSELFATKKCQPSGQSAPAPFLTMPSSCLLPFTGSVDGSAWPDREHPEGASLQPVEYGLTDLSGRSLGVTGCSELSFAPQLEVSPDLEAPSKPSGLTVRVKIPQEVAQNPGGLGSSSVKDTTVTLPQGLNINPSSADGLTGCTVGEAGFEKIDPDSTDRFTAEPIACQASAKIGTVKFKIPIIEHPLEGSVYLAAQNANPFGSLLAIYILAEDPFSGIRVKLAGEVHLSETGQVTTTLHNSPQAPLEEAEFKFFGGERAPFATPSRCGLYETKAVFTPWSATPPVTATSKFRIGGASCQNPLPFSPSLTAGTTNINAGAFSPLTTTISRADGNQDMQSVQLHMPAGLSGILAGVPLCPEAQANQGTCPAGSLIGETIVSAGVGADPVSVTGGKVYLTEKYAGAPFGLSIVNPVKAGPFDLEHDTANPNNNPPCDCVVVRAKIEVDPTTANLTITTDTTGPHAIPHLIDGIPVQIQKVNVLINRPNFTFNPTNCNPLSITGTIASAEGASSPVSVPFQSTNCAVLKFAPKIAVATAAKTTKANGSSLVFKISYPKSAMGSQSWFNEAKFDLPKQLPARLTTLQKACLASVFESNPAACPAASLIGHAVVRTPVLPVALTGPVYFVSHGGAKFPDAVLVLKGYGVTVNLVGETFINGKTGITSATFRNTPDVPFESIEVTVPQGRFSEFGANLPAKAKGSFCGQKLIMPTFFKAQNGLQIKQNTKVTVTGCHKAKKKHHARRHAKKGGHKTRSH
jgi:hypothetical protein